MVDSNIIVSFLSGVIVPVILHFIKIRSDRKKLEKRDKLKEEIKFSSLVYDKLESLKEEYKADRVWIEQFHNGGHFYPTGKSIQKFSMFYEVVSPHASSIKMQFQNIPVNLFSHSTNELLLNDVISIPSNINDSYGLKYIMEETDNKSAYLFAIKSIDNKFIGILGVDYTKEEKFLNSEDLKYLQVEASSIGGVLMNHLLNK